MEIDVHHLISGVECPPIWSSYRLEIVWSSRWSRDLGAPGRHEWPGPLRQGPVFGHVGRFQLQLTHHGNQTWRTWNWVSSWGQWTNAAVPVMLGLCQAVNAPPRRRQSVRGHGSCMLKDYTVSALIHINYSSPCVWAMVQVGSRLPENCLRDTELW